MNCLFGGALLCACGATAPLAVPKFSAGPHIAPYLAPGWALVQVWVVCPKCHADWVEREAEPWLAVIQ